MFLKFKWFLKKASYKRRFAIEIYNEMNQAHDEYLKNEREGKNEQAQKDKFKRDILRWVLCIPDGE